MKNKSRKKRTCAVLCWRGSIPSVKTQLTAMSGCVVRTVDAFAGHAVAPVAVTVAVALLTRARQQQLRLAVVERFASTTSQK